MTDVIATGNFPFSAVIFDMDGVIVDTEWVYTRQERVFADENNLPVADHEIIALVGQSHQTFKRTLQDWWSRIGRELTPEEAEATFLDWAAGHPIDYPAVMLPGVLETLSRLHEMGVRIALASSSPMESISAVLGGCGIAEYFEVIVSGKDFTESKPNPAIYLSTIERLGLPADACCCIEDSVPGITAGKAAGLTVFARREERFGFTQEMADVVIDKVSDIFEASATL